MIKQPIEFVADDSLTGMAVKDFHSPKLKKMKIAWLTSANQVGFELIQYGEPKAERRADSFARPGNQELPIVLLLIQILKDCVKESLTLEENNDVRFGK